MAAMFFAPGVWIQAISAAGGIDAISPGYLFQTLGVLLMAEGILYLQLPVDIIPDFIPLIGQCDDFVAWLVVLAGLGLLSLGFWIA